MALRRELNDAWMMMISVGHRMGLFDTLANGAAVTSHSLAEGTALHKRYLCERLGAIDDARRRRYGLRVEIQVTREALHRSVKRY